MSFGNERTDKFNLDNKVHIRQTDREAERERHTMKHIGKCTFKKLKTLRPF